MRLPDFKGFYAEAGKAMAGQLLCRKCGARRACPPADASRYLAKGWPKCCGYTIELRTGKAVRS